MVDRKAKDEVSQGMYVWSSQSTETCFSVMFLVQYFEMF